MIQVTVRAGNDAQDMSTLVACQAESRMDVLGMIRRIFQHLPVSWIAEMETTFQEVDRAREPMSAILHDMLGVFVSSHVSDLVGYHQTISAIEYRICVPEGYELFLHTEMGSSTPMLVVSRTYADDSIAPDNFDLQGPEGYTAHQNNVVLSSRDASPPYLREHPSLRSEASPYVGTTASISVRSIDDVAKENEELKKTNSALRDRLRELELGGKLPNQRRQVRRRDR